MLNSYVHDLIGSGLTPRELFSEVMRGHAMGWPACTGCGRKTSC